MDNQYLKKGDKIIRLRGVNGRSVPKLLSVVRATKTKAVLSDSTVLMNCDANNGSVNYSFYDVEDFPDVLWFNEKGNRYSSGMIRYISYNELIFATKSMEYIFNNRCSSIQNLISSRSFNISEISFYEDAKGAFDRFRKDWTPVVSDIVKPIGYDTEKLLIIDIRQSGGVKTALCIGLDSLSMSSIPFNVLAVIRNEVLSSDVSTSVKTVTEIEKELIKKQVELSKDELTFINNHSLTSLEKKELSDRLNINRKQIEILSWVLNKE